MNTYGLGPPVCSSLPPYTESLDAMSPSSSGDCESLSRPGTKPSCCLLGAAEPLRCGWAGAVEEMGPGTRPHPALLISRSLAGWSWPVCWELSGGWKPWGTWVRLLDHLLHHRDNWAVILEGPLRRGCPEHLCVCGLQEGTVHLVR